MAIAFFDLDNTLLNGDSDVAFSEFLCEKNLVDVEIFTNFRLQAYKDYQNGVLDIVKYQEQAQQILVDNSIFDLLKWRAEFLNSKIEKMITKDTIALIQQHKEVNDLCVIVSATNDFIVKAIASRLNIDFVLATTCKMENGKYIGKIDGTPCYQEGKIIKVKEFIKDNNLDLQNAYFYSDSHNDIPLLDFVENAIVVNPDEKLREYAIKKNWQIFNLHK